MRNKKGFTLIELLAVIVILAIIMVIAIPQILNVINNSRKSSWDNSVKLVARAIDLNNTLDQTGVTNGSQKTGYPLSDLCSSGTVTNFDKITDAGDIDASNSSCSVSNGVYVFSVVGKGQFSNYTADITCSAKSACTVSNIEYGGVASSGSGSSSVSYSYQTRSGTTDNVPSQKFYIRTNLMTNQNEACGEFTNGTTCMVNNPNGYSLTSGYAIDKKNEMLSNGASCTDYTQYIQCSDTGVYCSIYYNGTVICAGGLYRWCKVNGDGSLDISKC